MYVSPSSLFVLTFFILVTKLVAHYDCCLLVAIDAAVVLVVRCDGSRVRRTKRRIYRHFGE